MSDWHEIDALRLAAASSRRNQLFLMEILETELPGVQFNVVQDDEVELSPTSQSPHTQMENAGIGTPRLVDSARESHIVPGYQHTVWGWGSEHAAMKILEKGRSGEFEEVFSEAVDGVVGTSHSQCLKFLGRKGPDLLMRNLESKETICSALLDMAEHVKVLAPGNEPLPWDVLDMTLWRASVCELVKEMKTVEERCPSLLGTSGVYVLTTSPYSAFLRALSAEIADCRRS